MPHFLEGKSQISDRNAHDHVDTGVEHTGEVSVTTGRKVHHRPPASHWEPELLHIQMLHFHWSTKKYWAMSINYYLNMLAACQTAQ